MQYPISLSCDTRQQTAPFSRLCRSLLLPIVTLSLLCRISDPLRRHSLGQNVRVNDDEWRRVASARNVSVSAIVRSYGHLLIG